MKPRIKKKHAQAAEIKAKILKQFCRNEPVTRTSIAKELRLAQSTAGIYVDRLIAQGLILESSLPSPHKSKGRPAKRLQINPKGGRFIGVDFDAQNVRAIAIDLSQKPIKNVHRELQSGGLVDEVLREIEAAIDEANTISDRPLLGIGVGVPGSIDFHRGIAIDYQYIRGWQNIDIRSRLRDRYAVPVFLENNIRSMAIAELLLGEGRTVNSFVCLGIRSGIGAGVVINQKLVRGEVNLAGEIGAWKCRLPDIVTGDTRIDGVRDISAAQDVSLESIASISGLVRRYSQVKGICATSQSFFDAVRSDDSTAIELLRQAAVASGQVIGRFNLLLNPGIVVISSQLTAYEQAFMEPLRKTVAEEISAKHSTIPQIVASQLGDCVGALGAASLAAACWKPKHEPVSST